MATAAKAAIKAAASRKRKIPSKPTKREETSPPPNEDEEEEEEDDALSNGRVIKALRDHFYAGYMALPVDNKRARTRQSVQGSDGIFEPLMPEQPINMLQVHRVTTYCKSNHVVVGVVQFLLNYVRAGGLTVVLEKFGIKIPLNADLQNVFDIEWTDLFLENLLWGLLTAGFVVCTLVPSNVKEGEMVPMVIDYTLYCITMVKVFGQRTTFKVYPMINGLNSVELFGREGFDRTGKTQDEDRNVCVYLNGLEPNADGTIVSPLKTMLEKLFIVDLSWVNFATADYRTSHPPYIFEHVEKKAQGDPLEDAVDAPGEELVGVSKRLTTQNDDFDAHRVSRNLDDSRAVWDRETRRYTGRPSATAANPYAVECPWARPLTVPSEFKRVDPPPTQINTQIETMDRVMAINTARAVGLPSGPFESKHSANNGNAEIHQTALQRTTDMYQKRIKPILQDLYGKAYAEAHQRFLDREASKLKAKRDTLDEEDQEHDVRERGHSPYQHQHRGPFGMERVVHSSGQPGEGARAMHNKEHEASDKSQAIGISKIIGYNINKPPQFASSKLNQRRLSDEDIEELVRLGVRFEVSFMNSSLASAEDLRNAYDLDNLIPYTQYSERSARILGMDKSCINTEEQHIKQIMDRAKLQNKVAEASGERDEQQKSGGAAKPKAKSSASDSSKK